MTKEGTNTLEYKQSILNGLTTVIGLNRRPLAHSEKEKIEALEFGLTTRLSLLVDECKMREMDLKIESMNQVIVVLKNNVYSL